MRDVTVFYAEGRVGSGRVGVFGPTHISNVDWRDGSATIALAWVTARATYFLPWYYRPLVVQV